MNETLKTVLYDRHVKLGAKMVEFGGWQMPIQYPKGIVHEHLTTRKQAGLFDVSHMGRFTVRGKNALAFLQHVLTNNAAALDTEQGQYTMIANENGGAVDDAYLYRFVADEYLLVVNAANRGKDWAHLQSFLGDHGDVVLTDRTDQIAMVSLQGPLSKEILSGMIDSGHLPEPLRNELSSVSLDGIPVQVARTGYTGEPICFELFIPVADAQTVWDGLLDRGAEPVGLGARDTLRLEAGLPLYGHELGTDPDENEMPIFSCPLSRFAVSLSALKGDFVGRKALERQFAALKKILDRNYALVKDLPRITVPVEMTGRGIARAGCRVFHQEKPVGYVTSGTMVPYWLQTGTGINSRLTDETAMRAIGLALLDSTLCEGDKIEIEIRGKKVGAAIVPYHLRGEAPPFARAITCHGAAPAPALVPEDRKYTRHAKNLVERAVSNTRWRQRECINLIPSEQTPSLFVRALCALDPAGRYAEHKPLKAFNDTDVFYYQGTDFIGQVEELLVAEMRRYLGCRQIETKVVSGQMANTAVFSAMIDSNRADDEGACSEGIRLMQSLCRQTVLVTARSSSVRAFPSSCCFDVWGGWGPGAC
jgi:aminomethyltransferase